MGTASWPLSLQVKLKQMKQIRIKKMKIMAEGKPWRRTVSGPEWSQNAPSYTKYSAYQKKVIHIQRPIVLKSIHFNSVACM